MDKDQNQAFDDGGHVYFASDGRAIKIGFSDRPSRRLVDIQTSNHRPIELLATVPASLVDELSLHQRFAHLRIRGEWFRPTKELRAFIEEIKAAGVLTVALTRWDIRRARGRLIALRNKEERGAKKYSLTVLVGRLSAMLAEPDNLALYTTFPEMLASHERYHGTLPQGRVGS